MEQKEGIDMDEKKTDPSGYEPNFVMRRSGARSC